MIKKNVHYNIRTKSGYKNLVDIRNHNSYNDDKFVHPVIANCCLTG
jgi:hypothetical protein